MKVVRLIILFLIIFYFGLNYMEYAYKKSIRDDLIELKSKIDIDTFEYYMKDNPYSNEYKYLLDRYRENKGYEYAYTVRRICNEYYYNISAFLDGEFEENTIPSKVDEEENYDKVYYYLSEHKVYHSIVKDKYGNLMSSYIKLDNNLILALDVPANMIIFIKNSRDIIAVLFLLFFIFYIERSRKKWM